MNIQMQEFIRSNVTEISRALTGKQIISVENDGGGMDNHLIIAFTDGTALVIRYDWIYEWGIVVHDRKAIEDAADAAEFQALLGKVYGHNINVTYNGDGTVELGKSPIGADYHGNIKGAIKILRDELDLRGVTLAQAAQAAVQNAVFRGALPVVRTLTCQICSDMATHYHHESYEESRRLDVVPLCAKCHKGLHAGIVSLSKEGVI